jgi:hypothetical protein
MFKTLTSPNPIHCVHRAFFLVHSSERPDVQRTQIFQQTHRHGQMDRVGGRCAEDERRGKLTRQAGGNRRRGGVEKRRRRVGNILREMLEEERRRLHMRGLSVYAVQLSLRLVIRLHSRFVHEETLFEAIYINIYILATCYNGIDNTYICWYVYTYIYIYIYTCSRLPASAARKTQQI